MRRHSSLWLFLIGLGYHTQFRFVGSIGISELPVFLLAPFMFVKDYKLLKRDGFMTIIGLAILCCIGCCVSSYCNSTPYIFFIKGLAHPYSIFAATVVLHRLLRDNFSGFKWLLLGLFLSSIICVFVFQPETHTTKGGQTATGEVAVEAMLSYALFWSHKVKAVLTLPVQALYLSVPYVYSCVAIMASVVTYIFFSGSSGRSAATATFISFILVALGGKSRKRIELLGKRLWLLIFAMLAALVLMKSAYSFLAKSGYLGESAQNKYYFQTRTGTDILHMLMAGRMELFCGVIACLDHPILGFGPKGEDTEGYVANYLRKYAAENDYLNYIRSQQEALRQGKFIYNTIPAHSYIAEFWIYYGIAGLIVWIYVLWLFYCSFRKGWCSAVPQWYGFICLSMGIRLWDIFFSPFATRLETPLLLTCILFARQIKLKRMELPLKMELEARKYE